MPRGRKRNLPDPLIVSADENSGADASTGNRSGTDSQLIDSKPKYNKIRKVTIDLKTNANTDFDFNRLIDWFRKYTAHDSDMIEPEGIELFCRDIFVDPGDIVMLLFAYKMRAKRMGYFTRDEWFRLMVPIECDTLEKFLSIVPQLRALLDDEVVFKELFRFAFDFSKNYYQKTIDIATGSQMLQLLLADKWPLLDEFVQFLVTFEYKAINRDQWNNLLEFSRHIRSDLSNYDFDGAC